MSAIAQKGGGTFQGIKLLLSELGTDHGFPFLARAACQISSQKHDLYGVSGIIGRWTGGIHPTVENEIALAWDVAEREGFEPSMSF